VFLFTEQNYLELPKTQSLLHNNKSSQPTAKPNSDKSPIQWIFSLRSSTLAKILFDK